MRHPVKKNAVWLLLAVLFLSGSCLIAIKQAARVPYRLQDKQVEAAQKMQRCMDAIRSYKEELHIPLSPGDLHGTGLLGEDYNDSTTTAGILEAKRTTASTDMAALMVVLLNEAGIRSGSRVGAVMSGSFPGMNLALISACTAMDVDLIYISSAGSSTYGANNPTLTFPDMAYRLVEDGLLPTHAAALSMGGDRDCGDGLNAAWLTRTHQRLLSYGLPFIEEPDYEKNLQLRRGIFGQIDCFVSVGGHISAIGLEESPAGQGVLRMSRSMPGKTDGLLQHYLYEGVPVIQILNIKKLMADYALPYDPPNALEIGTGGIYFQSRYPRLILLAGLVGAGIFFWMYLHTQTRGIDSFSPDTVLGRKFKKIIH